MPRYVAAVSWEQTLASGRTKPQIFRCAGDDGLEAGFVVKLRGSLGARGLFGEFFCSALAEHFGLPVPAVVAVTFSQALVDALSFNPTVQSSIAASLGGASFGSEYCEGASLFPPGSPLPPTLRTTAAEIFAFDALVENPDRRTDKPNLLQTAGRFLLIDHELALQTELVIRGKSRDDDLRFMRQHVLFESLRGKELDLGRFRNRLAALTPDVLQSCLEQVPADCVPSDASRALHHLLTATVECDDLIRCLQELVA